jgi:homoserine dehydrogenase
LLDNDARLAKPFEAMTRSKPPPGTPDRRRPHGGAAVGVALLGCGTVGSGVLRLLAENAAYFAERVGVPIEVRHVVVRDVNKERTADCDRRWLTSDIERVFADEAVELVVEVMGGIDAAGAAIERALGSGRSVVTANKALLAERGPRLLELARESGADLAFEAAVGGGIPIIRTLRDAFASDEVGEIVGILNGTSNFVLTRMKESGASFASALAEAQRLGYAEADPTLDVGGHDAAQKLAVLAMLAFGVRATEKEMLVEGITELGPRHFAFAERFGYVIKHLVIGRVRAGKCELRAHPALVPRSSVFANVTGSLNAIKLEGRALGPCFLSGRGAGDMPTAVSVVSDILDGARSIVAGIPGLITRGRPMKPCSHLPRGDTTTSYLISLDVADKPGVLAAITAALAEHAVSIAQIVQTRGEPDAAEVVLLTHEAREGDVMAAREALSRASFMRAPPFLLRIEDV